MDNLQFVPTYDIDVAAEWLNNGLVLVALEALDNDLFATTGQHSEMSVSDKLLCKCRVQYGRSRFWRHHAHLLDVHAA